LKLDGDGRVSGNSASHVRRRLGITGFPCRSGVGSAILKGLNESALTVRQMIRSAKL
jgi:hypothetical protein